MKDNKSNVFNQVEYINQYHKTHYTTVKVLFKRNNDTLDRLENMQIVTGKSRNQLILEAVKEYLDRHFI